ncbi:hypothetical protein J7T55_005165 [Diaporthe amygdali]|uniref:uncharacterized protein n=1 Tax=Phomopsis amygdali TaxID=1214568 RepID=UPI0022FDCE3F|nr:uncharacterized protein J7T55_005165 [Diaporthe amygdali]KAJ0116219.1 hypothetical protein J7T55_005165 [Diaporthe amygdali]
MTPLLWPLGAIILFYALRLIYIPKPLPGIPYNRLSYFMPWGDLLSLGISFFSRGEVFRWFNTRSHHHRSHIFQAFIPSFSTSSPVLVVTDPAEVKDIVTRQLSSIDRSRLMGLWFGLLAPGASIGMPSGGSFRALRWAWNSMLSPVFLGNVAGPRIRDAALSLVELWSLKGGTQQCSPFEACRDLRLSTLEAMMGLLLGRELGMLETEISDLKRAEDGEKLWHWRRGRPEAQPRHFYRDFSLTLTCLDWVTQGVSPTVYSWVFRHLFWPFQRAQKNVEASLQRVVNDVRQKLGGEEKAASYPISALELVLQRATSRPQTEKIVSDAALRSELIELLITGHETTASSIGWALKYLADDQTVQKRLHEELLQFLPESAITPTSEQIMTTHLPYLDAFIAETLRYSCTGPISFREATQDCTVLGHLIPSGTPIVLMTQDVTHQEATYLEKEPKSAPRHLASTNTSENGSNSGPPLNHFYPERWLNTNGGFEPKAVFSLPFSDSLRGCFGRKIAMMEMRIFLAVLVWNFRFAKLDAGLSRYGSLDGLTRKPSCCYVLPIPRRGRVTDEVNMSRTRLPPLCVDVLAT